MLLDDEVAVITGSTGGIGECAARELARNGARVVITGRRADEGNAVAESITTAGGAARFVEADLTRDDDIQRIFDAAREQFGPVTVLVNNAAPTDMIGRPHGDGRLTDVSGETFDAIMRVGIRAAYRCCYHAIPLMQRAGHGSIINVSSLAGAKGSPGVFAYSVAKGALQALTRSVAVDYARDGIRANTVMVGFVLSNPQARAWVEDPAVNASMRASHLTRFGEPEDIAAVIRFLASSESEFICGSEIYADGGSMIS